MPLIGMIAGEPNFDRLGEFGFDEFMATFARLQLRGLATTAVGGALVITAAELGEALVETLLGTVEGLELGAGDREPQPPGDPDNPMGRARLVYQMPYTIHGTDNLDSLGQAVSHGSIRLANEHVIPLAEHFDGEKRMDVIFRAEGWDNPHCNIIVHLRPTLSKVLWGQSVGRGLRSAPGKEKCIVIDVDANPHTAMHYGIMSIPTVAFFAPGEPPKAAVGFRPAEQLETAFGLEAYAQTA